MRRLVLMLAMCAVTAWAGEAQPRADDPKVEARLVVLAEELRCLVCQNESLASSNAELAEDLRREVRKLIRDGMTDAQIKIYLVERYGDFVLYRPPVKPMTWPLWFGPFVLLFLAVWGLWRYLRHRKALVHQRMSVTDNAQAESLLKE